MARGKYEEFLGALRAIADRDKVAGVTPFFWPNPDAHSSDNKSPGVGIGKIFPIAKQFVEVISDPTLCF